MWEFPRFEVNSGGQPLGLEAFAEGGWIESAGELRHSVTHHRIRVEVNFIRSEGRRPDLRWIPIDELDSVPMPAPQRKALALVLEILG
jgi:adenine-specific DNA glycosylase